jgi:hypothetical protein
MRRPEPLDPAVERELAALDAALAAAPDADAELALLVRDVRAAAPRLDAAARERLDARVEAGAAVAPEAKPARRLPRLRGRVLVPAFGVLAAALLTVVLVGRAGESDGGGAASRGGQSPAEVQSRTTSGTASSGAGAASPAPSLAAPAPPPAPSPAPGRRVERGVELSLGARAGRFDEVTDGVVRTTQRAGGFVAESSTRRSGSRGTATFVLRIPAARLDAAVGDLSRLAHVRSIQQSATDLTGATDGTAGRLRDARAQRRAIVTALATASGARAGRLRARLSRVTARERALEGSLRALRARTTYATVDLTVTSSGRQAVAPANDGRWTPADAWRDARRALELAAGVAIVALALVLPLALLGGAAALTGRAVRRRRREAALDVV